MRLSVWPWWKRPGAWAYALDKRKEDNELEGAEFCKRFVLLQVLFESREEFDNACNSDSQRYVQND